MGQVKATKEGSSVPCHSELVEVYSCITQGRPSEEQKVGPAVGNHRSPARRPVKGLVVGRGVPR